MKNTETKYRARVPLYRYILIHTCFLKQKLRTKTRNDKNGDRKKPEEKTGKKTNQQIQRQIHHRYFTKPEGEKQLRGRRPKQLQQ